MVKPKHRDAISILSDDYAKAEDRAFAAESLASEPDDLGIEMLIEVGGRPDQPDVLRTAIGRSLAAIDEARLDGFDMSELHSAVHQAMTRA